MRKTPPERHGRGTFFDTLKMLTNVKERIAGLLGRVVRTYMILQRRDMGADRQGAAITIVFEKCEGRRN